MQVSAALKERTVKYKKAPQSVSVPLDGLAMKSPVISPVAISQCLFYFHVWEVAGIQVGRKQEICGRGRRSPGAWRDLK